MARKSIRGLRLFWILWFGLAAQTVMAEPQAPIREIKKIGDIAGYFGGCFQKQGLEIGKSGKEITLRLSLRKDGSLIGAPRITYLRKISSPQEQNLFLESLQLALKACLPVPISEALGNVVAGRPLAIRFIYESGQRIDL